MSLVDFWYICLILLASRAAACCKIPKARSSPETMYQAFHSLLPTISGSSLSCPIYLPNATLQSRTMHIMARYSRVFEFVWVKKSGVLDEVSPSFKAIITSPPTSSTLKLSRRQIVIRRLALTSTDFPVSFSFFSCLPTAWYGRALGNFGGILIVHASRWLASLIKCLSFSNLSSSSAVEPELLTVKSIQSL